MLGLQKGEVQNWLRTFVMTKAPVRPEEAGIGSAGIKREPIPAIFVASKHALAETPGGVQICTQEYLKSLEWGGFNVECIGFKPSNKLQHKILRRLDRRPYRYSIPPSLSLEIANRLKRKSANLVFLNGNELSPLALEIKSHRPGAKVVLLSLGVESVDYLHELRIGNSVTGYPENEAISSRSSVYGTGRLGQLIVEESRQREFLDGTVTLAQHEVEFEKWLGSKHVMCAPRTIRRTKFDWVPKDGYIGFVGRLDHPPNVEGLALTLRALQQVQRNSIRFRLVGAPEEEGRQIASHYSFVDYLGVLSDEELLKESQKWSCAINPVFCYPRGATTKLAVYLGWGLPVVTTTSGMRGYEWSEGKLPRK